MLPTLNVGPLVVPTGPLSIILGAWLALSMVEWAARRLNLNVATTYGLASMGLFAGIIGARLIFVALHWSAYQENLLGIVWPINSGFDLTGGLLIGLAAAFFYGRKEQIAPWPTFDALIAGILVGFIFFSLSDFLGGPGYGKITTMPWAINQFSIRRHPVQIYEILAGLAGLGLWWRTLTLPLPSGGRFLMAAALYGAGRLFVDAYKANPWLTPNGLHVTQLIALATTLVALTLLVRLTPAIERGD